MNKKVPKVSRNDPKGPQKDPKRTQNRIYLIFYQVCLNMALEVSLNRQVVPQRNLQVKPWKAVKRVMPVLHLRLMEGWFAFPFASFSRKFWKKLEFSNPLMIYIIYTWRQKVFWIIPFFLLCFWEGSKWRSALTFQKMSSEVCHCQPYLFLRLHLEASLGTTWRF